MNDHLDNSGESRIERIILKVIIRNFIKPRTFKEIFEKNGRMIDRYFFALKTIHILTSRSGKPIFVLK